MKKAHVFLFDGYADWELGNVLAELRRLGKVEVISVCFSDKIVTSMGCLKVKPDITFKQINIDDILIFILPGGYMWEKSYPQAEIELFLDKLAEEQIPIAAICAATTVLARAGILKGKNHTSNSRAYLKKIVPEYADDDNYINKMSVRDKHIITASGLGSVEFTADVLCGCTK
jgi:putative intracellular protease/amidase